MASRGAEPELGNGPLRAGALATTCPPLSAVLLAVLLSGCANSGDVESARQARVADNPEAMLRIADAAEQSGDSGGALAFYRRAGELQPGSVPARIGVARSLTEQGSVAEAIDVLKSTHASDPSNAQVSVTLGRLLVAAGRPAEALAVFRDGLLIDGKSTPLLIGKGVALDGLGQHGEAQSVYREVLRIDPDSAPARKNLSLSQSLSRGNQAAAARNIPHVSAVTQEARSNKADAAPVLDLSEQE